MVELIDNQSPSSEVPLKSKRSRRKEDVRRQARGRGATEMSGSVGVIERKEFRGDDLIEYFLPTEVRSTF